MRRIIVSGENDLHISLVNECNPIFAKKDGILVGMIVNEENKGWILRLGGTFGANGHCDNLKECICKGQKSGYEFFT